MELDTRKSELIRQWDDGFVVRHMRQDEGQQVIKWFSALTTMYCDLQVLLHVSEEGADGLYVGELNGKMVASAVEMAVAADVSYIGCVFIDEHHRKSGFARRIITTARDIGDRHNSSSIVALDTHPYLELMYEKFDFKTAYKSSEYRGVISTSIDLSRCGTDVRQVRTTSFVVCSVVLI